MNIRRYYIPNSIVFITQVVDARAPIFQHERFVTLLRNTLRTVKSLHPFQMIGYVFLPEHFHLMIQPTGTSTFTDIMHSLKPSFTKAYKSELGISGKMKFWQKGFWDHIIRDEIDFERHLDYIHYNPVKHNLVEKPEDWPHSSFGEWKRRNAYPDKWGWTLPLSIQEFEWQKLEADYDS